MVSERRNKAIGRKKIKREDEKNHDSDHVNATTPFEERSSVPLDLSLRYIGIMKRPSGGKVIFGGGG